MSETTAASRDDPQFAALVLRFLDDSITARERAELERRLVDDPAARDEFTRLCVDAGQFTEIFAADQLTVGEPEDEPLVNPHIAPPSRSRWRRVAATLAQPGSVSLLIAAISISALLAVLAWQNAPVFRTSENRRPLLPVESPFVARLVRSPEARWVEGSMGFADGTLLHAGERLDLASGTVDVVFNDGAQVTLEGPARFYAATTNSGQLESGKLTGRVPPEAVGFAIRTNQVEIVDLGTEFGVSAERQNSTEVHVFRGAVRVEAYNAETRRTLSAGQALTVLNTGRMVARSSEPAAFVRRSIVETPTAKPDTYSIGDDFDSVQTQLSGWASAWSLHGAGRVFRDVEHPFDTASGAYLHVNATNAEVRTLRREYKKFGDVDPAKPHTIRWKWRYDGDPKALTNFHDRIHFFADSASYAGTTFSNAWLIAIAFGVEGEAHPPVGKWTFFDSHKSGKHSDAYAERNMVNTGMELRPGVVYAFEVRVDPARGTYSATMNDGVETFSADGMHFRSGKPGANPVLHFGGCASGAKENQAFSIDSLEILGVAAAAP